LVPVIDTVRLPEQAQLYYTRLLKELRAAHGNLRESRNIFIRMRQVSSGFIGLVDEELDERVQVAFHETPKLDRLLARIAEVPPDRQWVVVYEFTYSGRLISERLSKLGITHGWLWSGTKDVRETTEKFNSGAFRGMLVNARKGVFGTNLQAANYLFFYESPVPVLNRKQAERRCRRKGQKRTVFQYDLVVQGTVDKRILQFHREGADLFQAIMRDPSVLEDVE
jgi:hypothetical protein